MICYKPYQLKSTGMFKEPDVINWQIRNIFDKNERWKYFLEMNVLKSMNKRLDKRHFKLEGRIRQAACISY